MSSTASTITADTFSATSNGRESGRSNHYLSDIVGLLFIAAYLPPTAETDAWLAFATNELVGETERQFHRDGGHYEGSTSYHRLSGELAVSARR